MEQKQSQHILSKLNYYLMIGGILLIIIGYFLMRGGRQDGPEFNADEIYSTARITVAPILILLGFIIEIVAIFYVPKQTQE